MEKPRIINYIDIDGEDILMESLPDEKRRKIAETLQDRLMSAMGYKRITA